jgi:hypothetical protein
VIRFETLSPGSAVRSEPGLCAVAERAFARVVTGAGAGAFWSWVTVVVEAATAVTVVVIVAVETDVVVEVIAVVTAPPAGGALTAAFCPPA